ncbi:poly-gamma-glutamate hydrolase family protein [Bacillus atrophaeus]|uniref:poly-gamma-glutamate hydrolase family protein n=1 Tax=Bacillus atrophaeus TaxID=1452 RepID=UPI002281B855|nr:poly-gamma-glutamate hydrolase family protein [Bacillus atrophaeus]MCY8934628.1 poly-gamma-glutamate hydrolase family protein [Bacillus atrophaeus]MCY8940668.1 poly-gamma-glutamate hydrolase family protein [Bacillus atrophaeus]MCY8945589.1 poly-gamma-glutamate hydrolase family protein [Bacillus atrophaeus]
MKPAKVTLLHRMLHCLKHVDCNIVKYFTSTYLLVNISLFVIILFPFSVIAAAEDEYANFEELKNNTNPSDYGISTQERNTSVLVLAIHGGGIEGGTSELARELSKHHSMYLFEGLMPSGNSVLHITSTHFDEPASLTMARGHMSVISIHGYSADEKNIKVGGTDRNRAALLVETLHKAGFPAELLSAQDKYAGVSPDNIANKSISGLSIQLELSMGFRKSMFETFSLKSRSSTQNQTFYKFTETISDFINAQY